MTNHRFDTTEFERSNITAPRGRGSWAFCPASKARANDYLDHTVFSPGGMTLTEARKWALTQPALANCQHIAVMP